MSGNLEQLDAATVVSEPGLAVDVEVVARAVVDDEEELATMARHQLAQEREEGPAVEHIGEPVVELRVLDGERAEDVGRLPQPVGVDAGLFADARPGLMERAIEPEARFVGIMDEATNPRGSF